MRQAAAGLSPASSAALREAETSSLRRGALHAITTLDVLRRKWTLHSEAGRKALSGCVNAHLQVGHAEAGSWPSGFGAVRASVVSRALQLRRKSESELRPVMEELESVVTKMKAATEAFRAQAEAASSSRESDAQEPYASLSTHPLLHGESIERLVRLANDVVRAFESELQLRRTVAAELAGACSAAAASGSGWDASARLLLSAWVLEPYLETEKLDLLFDSLAAEPAAVIGRRRQG